MTFWQLVNKSFLATCTSQDCRDSNVCISFENSLSRKGVKWLLKKPTGFPYKCKTKLQNVPSLPGSALSTVYGLFTLFINAYASLGTFARKSSNIQNLLKLLWQIMRINLMPQMENKTKQKNIGGYHWRYITCVVDHAKSSNLAIVAIIGFMTLWHFWHFILL